MRLCWRPYTFRLRARLDTARGALLERSGWLLRLEGDDGRVGWGEAAPLEQDPAVLVDPIGRLGPMAARRGLERALPGLPPALAFALGAALAEIDGLVGGAEGWLTAPPPARLLPAGEAALEALAALAPGAKELAAAGPPPLTVKWKVAACPDPLERRLLERLLALLPRRARLRLDANGGWDWATAAAWAERLAGEGRLEWLEQPLPPAEAVGLERLAARLPVALDESLREDPGLCRRWPGWQVRRPSQEGDPRPLLRSLQAGTPRLVLSTGFETGIGRRWLEHLAALQARGPTPAAPGLAPGWLPGGPLFGHDPEQVWEAVA